MKFIISLLTITTINYALAGGGDNCGDKGCLVYPSKEIAKCKIVKPKFVNLEQLGLGNHDSYERAARYLNRLRTEKILKIMGGTTFTRTKGNSRYKLPNSMYSVGLESSKEKNFERGPDSVEGRYTTLPDHIVYKKPLRFGMLELYKSMTGSYGLYDFPLIKSLKISLKKSADKKFVSFKIKANHKFSFHKNKSLTIVEGLLHCK